MLTNKARQIEEMKMKMTNSINSRKEVNSSAALCWIEGSFNYLEKENALFSDRLVIT
jgi:hypothetical protein